MMELSIRNNNTLTNQSLNKTAILNNEKTVQRDAGEAAMEKLLAKHFAAREQIINEALTT